MRPELRLLDVPAAPLLRAQAHEGDVAVGKDVVGVGSTQEELIVRRRLAARRPHGRARPERNPAHERQVSAQIGDVVRERGPARRDRHAVAPLGHRPEPDAGVRE